MSDELSFMDGFTIGASRCVGQTIFKVFDWDKAAGIIKDKKPEKVYAGLRGDFNHTSGIIYEDGKIAIGSSAYLGSLWATPVMRLYFKNDSYENGDYEEIECYVEHHIDEDFKWTAETVWPDSAIEILGNENNRQKYIGRE